MQRFDRSSVPPPSGLQSPEACANRQALADYLLADPGKRAQTRVPKDLFDLDFESIHAGLNRLFDGKCAFCESAVPTSLYRFRPESGVIPVEKTPDAHLYYVWLGGAWENLYPICADCTPQRPGYFPVQGKRMSIPTERQLRDYATENLGSWRHYPLAERSLLLDPCAERRLETHLCPDLSGRLFALTERAFETITHFRLDRPELVERRGDRLRQYFRALTDEVLLQPRAQGREAEQILDFATLEFGGLWYLLCRSIASVLMPVGATRLSLSPVGMGPTFQKIVRSKGYESRLAGLQAKLEERLWKVISRDPGRAPIDSPLVSVRLNNFKGIEQLELAMPLAQAPSSANVKPLRPALLILGENAAGKSSILEALALALCTEEARGQLPVDIASLPLDPELLGAGQVAQCTSATVSVTFQNTHKRKLTIAAGAFWLDGTPRTPPVFAYGAFRQYQKQVRRYSAEKSIINLFDSTALLSNPEKWLLGLKQVEFDSVVRALRDILSIEGEFEVMERDVENQRCLIVTAAAGGRALCRTPLSLASSGYRSVLAMVCDIIQGLMNRRINPYFESLETAWAVVLIDEVEAHLHPRWKIQIMGALRSALPNVTFIATTHDPLCLRGMRDGEVIVMQRVASQDNPDSEWPVMVEQVVRLPNVSQLTIEQLLTSDFFSLSSTDQPDTERELAMFTDILAAREQGKPLTETQLKAWQRFQRDISDALPVGSTEVQRLVQEAVVEYLKSRRQVSSDTLAKLRESSKRDILKALGTL
ncbi:AAA family ATPase [Pseudomonas gingeri]|uniref:AAA family ATPase n=1 Tax=Pseudomonas gingeri TaxID=117681 RepID=UPI0015A4213E|nr:AAA family ATPase [Pseudomonas gingeri]NWD71310.1 AAA family ATPase [Pseudomonas gingeri]NWD72757.1 AAA family ATPase [Pseudomonas gingeri]